MIRLIILLLTIVFTSSNLKGQAPSFTDFEWDIVRVGYVTPFKNNQLKAGTSFATEVRYNIADNTALGLGFEGAVFNAFGQEDELDIDVSGVLSLTFERYFSSTSSNRGFYGLGLGHYSNGEIRNVNSDNQEVIEGPKSFGVSPRIGYELGHVRIMGQYHHTFKSASANYLNLTFSLTLWGGYNR